MFLFVRNCRYWNIYFTPPKVIATFAHFTKFKSSVLQKSSLFRHVVLTIAFQLPTLFNKQCLHHKHNTVIYFYGIHRTESSWLSFNPSFYSHQASAYTLVAVMPWPRRGSLASWSKGRAALSMWFLSLRERWSCHTIWSSTLLFRLSYKFCQIQNTTTEVIPLPARISFSLYWKKNYFSKKPFT